MSNDGHCGSVNQSLWPRVNVVRGHVGKGTMAPRSVSSEYRRYDPTGFSKFEDGGLNVGGCQLDALGWTLEGLLSSYWGIDGARLVSPGA